MGLTRPHPEGRRDIQCHQNGKLLLNEKRALKLMGEAWKIMKACFVLRLWHSKSAKCFVQVPVTAESGTQNFIHMSCR